jgi:hypothetical protein
MTREQYEEWRKIESRLGKVFIHACLQCMGRGYLPRGLDLPCPNCDATGKVTCYPSNQTDYEKDPDHVQMSYS